MAPPSVLLRYASLSALVVVALAVVIAVESWAAYRATSPAGELRQVLLVLGLAAGALPLALAGWVTALVLIRGRLRANELSSAAVRDSEVLHRAMFDGNPLPMWLYDLDSLAILAVNEAGLRQYGYARHEFLGKTITDLHTQQNDGALLARIGQLRAGLDSGSYSTRHTRRDGSILDVEVSGSTVSLEGWCARLVTCVDVTERRRLEEQLRQAQRMEAVGQLAGGVAHDFNNILNVILGYAELAQRGSDPQRQKARLREVVKAAERASQLTRQLLTFSRGQVVQPQVLDLNAVVADMDMMLRRLIGPGVELSTVAGAELGRVKADAGQIGQVILNLSVNARDAMPEGGPLLIETGNVRLDEEYARTHPGVTPGAYVMLAVTDAGCGMPPEVQQHIFEPFFSTKEKDKGTGLGLSTVYGIVKQSGGSIGVYSELGKGTCFKVYLPCVEGALEARERRPATPPPPAAHGETVLVVEDDAAVRTLTRQILEEAGFAVLEAPGSSAALDLASRTSIDVVLTDVMMPHMDGRELGRRLDEMRPGLSVVYMSGYTATGISRQGALEEGAPFLEKPFTAEALVDKLREALAQGEGERAESVA